VHTRHLVPATPRVYLVPQYRPLLNFVKTMLRLAGERQELGVVHDQMGSPTYAADLAVFLSELVQTDRFGIYHASNQGSCTWYEFANAIFEEAGIIMNVTPLETADYPRPAPRPTYSVVDSISIRANGFSELRHWREALKDFISIFKSDSETPNYS
jgi:dTDP-4-dehydrorhamnose reductase